MTPLETRLKEIERDRLTAMLDKMERTLEWIANDSAVDENDCGIEQADMYVRKAREALKELADFRGSK